MDQKIITRTFIFCFICSLIFISVSYSVSLIGYKSTKVVFCNVGQGDGAYIRVNNSIDILIDAGPDKKILNCLGRHMPFYDRAIEFAFISHPQKDHYGGYRYLIDRYKIDNLIQSQVPSESTLFKKLVQKLETKGIRSIPMVQGDSMEVLNAKITFLWPSTQAISQYRSSDDPNNISQVVLYEEGGIRILFTGDIEGEIIEKSIYEVEVLKIPHHGSSNGLTKNFLSLADPQVTVISVGKNNSYGHPAKEVLDYIKAHGSILKRTDLDDDVVFELKGGKLILKANVNK